MPRPPRSGACARWPRPKNISCSRGLERLALAQDSAEGVYRAALDMLGVNVAAIHPSAYRAILEAQPKPGMQRSRVAMDSVAMKSFAERYPHAASVKQLG